MCALRANLAPEAAHRAGEDAARRILALAEIERAPRVALYAALADELPTRGLFDALRQRGTLTLFPRCLDDGRLAFVPAERWEDLVPGRYGVSEPGGPAVTLEPDDAVVLPGVAFDGRGLRLGRGRGFYDRTFPPGAGPTPFLIGVGFGFQRVEAVPAGPGDRAVDVVVTDRETLRAREGKRP